ncbi:hypothetical protein [Pseudoalteromonas sp. G4]|uniref:hypothetical protein n=1 Tax=Pseudoalteromonas sp. G4 TaxID=2992761 RepID=UPI00237ED3FC|nr:hypothetical protein [Pseudoalteromonas sp. G4]MDE3272076.1 hypothetical protein [Pseudoalteromonas sp. G4]
MINKTPEVDTPSEPHQPLELPEGRLAYSSPDSNEIHIFDLATKQVINSFPLTNTPSALYTSPNGRYVVAIQRNESLVEFIDGGIYLEEHGDHHDLHEDAPTTNTFELLDVKPTHYVPVGEQALVFFDGDKDASADAGFAIISDESISETRIIAEHHYETYQHGTGQIRDNFVLATIRDVNSETSLPESIGLFEVHGDHFHQEQTFEHMCPDLHGSFQTEDYIAFACSDGVVKIKQEGELFTSSKIANPTTMPQGVRIGKFIGSEENNTIIGLSRGGVFTVNLETNEIAPFAWQSEGVTNYLAYSVSGDKEAVLVLDDAGFINVFDQHEQWQRTTRFQVINQIDEEKSAKLIANRAHDISYLVYGNTVYQINFENQSVNELITVEQGITNLTWLGAFEEEAHEH